jgi:hypothetical protein
MWAFLFICGCRSRRSKSNTMAALAAVWLAMYRNILGSSSAILLSILASTAAI